MWGTCMLLFFVFVILIPVFDQIIKFWVRNNLNEGYLFSTSIPFLKITHIKNFGAALGIFDGGKHFFIFISIAIIFALLYLILIKKTRGQIFVLASSFVIGGGIGNLVDRIFFGYVTDYLKLSFFPPVCNISDYFIALGIILLAFNL